jgi:proline iminopeptidase
MGCGENITSSGIDNPTVKEASEFTTTDGTRLQYRVEGKGIPCIDFGNHNSSPRKYSRELREHIKFIFMNTRLYAGCPAGIEATDITLAVLVDDIEQLRQTLGFDKVAVMGHSLMGLVALEYARRYPERTSRVIMVGTPALWNNEQSKRIIDAYWETHASDERKQLAIQKKAELTEEALGEASPRQAIGLQLRSLAPQWWYDPTYEGLVLFEGMDFNVDVWNHWHSVLMNDYDVLRGGEVDRPVFLAIGKYDFCTPIPLWDDRKDVLSKLSFEVFERSGHSPMIEEQTTFDEKLMDWVENTGPENEREPGR